MVTLNRTLNKKRILRVILLLDNKTSVAEYEDLLIELTVEKLMPLN